MPELLNNILTPAVRNKYKNLAPLICKKFGWESVHQFQIDGTLLQLLRRDTIVHVGTGRGKTAVAAGPFVLAENAQKLSIVVSPLVALQEEMKETFKNTFKLRAIVINSNTTSSLSDILLDIKSGGVQIILISPETLLSRRIIDRLLRDPDISKMIFSVIIDEAHCVSFWSDTFRKKYGALHIIRPFLPRNTPMIALSATLTPRVRRDIITRLNLSSTHIFINEGNDKHNLTVIAARAKYPLISLYDLAFLIPFLTFHPLDIPVTMVYADSIEVGQRIVRFLTSLLPPHLQNAGIIRPYNARLTHEYRALAMKGLREGNIRVLVCTDAAGMGCDLSNIERVVQWRVVGLSALIQRWGRSGRSGEKALGILLYEPSAEKVNPTRPGSQTLQSTQNPGKSTKKRQQRSALLKGGFRSEIAGAEPELQDDSPGEGVYALIQTNGCRRRIWNRIYGNEPVNLTVPCCDHCVPSVLDQIKTVKPRMERKPKLPSKGAPYLPAQRKLVEWRNAVFKRDFKGVTWASSVVLPDELIESLASYGPISTPELFEQLVREKAGKKWWAVYAKELAGVVLALKIEYVPLPPKSKKQKKRVLDSASENNASKRAKNTHPFTPNDPTHLVAGSSQDHSFQVNPQPPLVDMHSQSLQPPPMTASFSLSPDPTLFAPPQIDPPTSNNYIPPTPAHQHPYPTYPHPTYPHPKYPIPAYPYNPHNTSHFHPTPPVHSNIQAYEPQTQWEQPFEGVPNQISAHTVHQNSSNTVQQDVLLYTSNAGLWNGNQVHQPRRRHPVPSKSVRKPITQHPPNRRDHTPGTARVFVFTVRVNKTVTGICLYM
ncbi:hypothetical protein FRC07_013843 [Ceratobasidium sp. 392]|nr:hypothetical protein FRC07_013843 [Ceratobasidium sp. 392]